MHLAFDRLSLAPAMLGPLVANLSISLPHRLPSFAGAYYVWGLGTRRHLQGLA